MNPFFLRTINSYTHLVLTRRMSVNINIRIVELERGGREDWDMDDDINKIKVS